MASPGEGRGYCHRARACIGWAVPAISTGLAQISIGEVRPARRRGGAVGALRLRAGTGRVSGGGEQRRLREVGLGRQDCSTVLWETGPGRREGRVRFDAPARAHRPSGPWLEVRRPPQFLGRHGPHGRWAGSAGTSRDRGHRCSRASVRPGPPAGAAGAVAHHTRVGHGGAVARGEECSVAPAPAS